MHRLHMSSGGRYPVLRALAILQMLSSVVIALAGIIASIYLANWMETFALKLQVALGGIAATFFLVIFSMAFAELIKLLIDIEHNTRLAANVPNNGQAPGGTTDAGRTVLQGEETAEGALLRGH